MASQYRRRSLMLNTIAKVAQGNPTIITDSSSRRLKRLDIFGQSSQDGTPSVENPIPIISKEVSEIKVTGLNLFNVEWIKGLDEYQSQSKNVASFPKGKYCLSVQGLTVTDLKKGAYLTVRIKVGEVYTNTYWIMHPSSPNTKCLTGLNFDVISDFQINLFIYNDDEEQLQSVYDTLNGHIQLNNNFNAMPYEPYKEQKITLADPITLRGIPVSSGGNVIIDGKQYISDVITEKDGVIGVERDVEAFSLAIADMNNNEDFPGWKPLDVVDKILPPQANDTQITNTLCTIQSRTIYARRDIKLLYFSSDKSLGKTQAELIEQYPDLSVDFAAISYEPTFEPLPEEVQAQYKALKSYYPNTVIQTGCWNEVTYSAKRGG